jgi:hypothetical protein
MQWTWPEKANVNELIDRLVIFGEHRGYQVRKVGHTGNVLEISKAGTMRLIAGLSSGLRLVITTKEDRTVIDVSEYGKEFALKAAVGVVGLSLFFVPTATAAYGAYMQNKLIDDVKKEVNDYFDSL